MKRRLSVFLNLLRSGRADTLSLDIENSDAIMKLLDAGIYIVLLALRKILCKSFQKLVEISELIMTTRVK